MIIFNHTKVDTKALEHVLYKAAKAVGSIRTSKVVIKVMQSQQSHGRVEPQGPPWYYRWALAGREHRGGDLTSKDREFVHTDGGYMFMWLGRWYDPLQAAEFFYSTAAHEWRHIRDQQKHMQFGQYNRNWKNRPHERRAINSCKRADRVKNSRTDIQDTIINLGVAIEESKNIKVVTPDQRAGRPKENEVAKKATGKAPAKNGAKDSQAAEYAARQKFIQEHGKAIAAEFAKKASKTNVVNVLQLNSILTCYALHTLGLIKTKDKHILVLVEDDKRLARSKDKNSKDTPAPVTE